MGLGGNPYGPAGTGKTESVKALGGLFGRQVLVFNCDEVSRCLAQPEFMYMFCNFHKRCFCFNAMHPIYLLGLKKGAVTCNVDPRQIFLFLPPHFSGGNMCVCAFT